MGIQGRHTIRGNFRSSVMSAKGLEIDLVALQARKEHLRSIVHPISEYEEQPTNQNPVGFPNLHCPWSVQERKNSPARRHVKGG